MCIDPMRVVIIKLDISQGKKEKLIGGVYCKKSLCNFVCRIFFLLLMFKKSYLILSYQSFHLFVSFPFTFYFAKRDVILTKKKTF